MDQSVWFSPRQSCLRVGEIRVTKTYGDQKGVMAVHTAGKFFGEVPLLLDMPYFVDGQARTPCRLLRYSKDQFWSLMRTCPSAAKEILRTMAALLREHLEGASSGSDRGLQKPFNT